MFRRLIALASTALITGALAGCGNTDSWVEAHAADGWAAQYGDAANSSYSDVAGAEALESGVEPLGQGRPRRRGGDGLGTLSGGQRARPPAGCSLMVWEADNNARQRWCTRLWQGGGSSSPLWDGFDNLYIGQPGTMMSFPPTQWFRWRRPVIGMPTTARILAPGHLLVVTHLGQVLLFDAHRGTVIGTPLDLVEGVDPTDSERGLADCRPARPRCPVAAAPAFAAKAGMVVVPVWQPGAPASVLVGLKYNPDRNPMLAVALDQRCRQGRDDGQPGGLRRRVDDLRQRPGRQAVGHQHRRRQAEMVDTAEVSRADPAVGSAGAATIIAGGGPDTRLVAIRDRGDHADVIWTRDDVSRLATSSRAGEHVAYTVVKDGEDGQALLVFDPADGHTVNSYPLPDASGWPVGVSIGHDRRVVASTSAGQVYGFAPA